MGKAPVTAGAVWLLALGLVHSLSLMASQVPTNDTERQLLDLMSHYKFNVMGSMRSMADLLQGFSAAFMLAALGMGVMDLAVARERAGLLKRVALVNVIWLATMVAVSLRYFFAAPTTSLSLVLVIFLLAWWQLPAEETRSNSAG